MTTVAFDGKIFASDSRISGGFIDQHGFDKIKVIEKDGNTLVISGCGELQLLCGFFNYMEGLAEDFPVAPGDSFSAMVYNVDENELILFENRMIPIPIYPPYAIGSGSDYAMGAMLVGADSIKAVEAASKLDSSTGGDIKFVDVSNLLNYVKVKKDASKISVNKNVTKTKKSSIKTPEAIAARKRKR